MIGRGSWEEGCVVAHSYWLEAGSGMGSSQCFLEQVCCEELPKFIMLVECVVLQVWCECIIEIQFSLSDLVSHLSQACLESIVNEYTSGTDL